MKRKTKNGLLVAGVVLASLTAVAGISYGVAVNKEGTDKVNDHIKDWFGDNYTLATNKKDYNLKSLDIMEKIYVKNEADLDIGSYSTEKLYREAAYDAVITDEYTEEDYLEDNKEVKLLSVSNVELVENETFTIKDMFDGNILEIEDKTVTITDHWSSDELNLVSTTFESTFKAAAEGTYDFYLIVNADSYELVVDYAS